MISRHPREKEKKENKRGGEQSSVIKIHGRNESWVNLQGGLNLPSKGWKDEDGLEGRKGRSGSWRMYSVGCIVIYGQTCRALQIVGRLFDINSRSISASFFEFRVCSRMDIIALVSYGAQSSGIPLEYIRVFLESFARNLRILIKIIPLSYTIYPYNHVVEEERLLAAIVDLKCIHGYSEIGNPE